MKSFELNKKDSNFAEINTSEGVGFVPKKLNRTVKYSDGSMIKVGKRVMYYTPTQRKKRNKRTKVLVGVIAVLGVGAAVFNPIITQSIERLKTKIELNNSPERKEIIDDLIPKSINSSEFLTETKNNDEYLNLSESALIAIDGLKSKINNSFSKYSNLEGSLTPAFVLINFENQMPKDFKLICDLDKDRFVCFEYDIADTDSFENMLEFRDMEVTDIINGFNNALVNRNLVDVPSVGRKINVEGRTYYLNDLTVDTEATRYNPETQAYDFEEFYTFNKYYTEGTKVSQEIMKANKSDIEKLEAFNKNNITSIYDIYLSSSSDFERNASLDLGKDKISMILISAKETNKNQKNNFEK